MTNKTITKLIRSAIASIALYFGLAETEISITKASANILQNVRV